MFITHVHGVGSRCSASRRLGGVRLLRGENFEDVERRKLPRYANGLLCTRWQPLFSTRFPVLTAARSLSGRSGCSALLTDRPPRLPFLSSRVSSLRSRGRVFARRHRVYFYDLAVAAAARCWRASCSALGGPRVIVVAGSRRCFASTRATVSMGSAAAALLHRSQPIHPAIRLGR